LFTPSPLLKIKDLVILLKSTTKNNLLAIDNLELTMPRGEILGLVGESGCGKTTTALSILRLLPSFSYITSGHIIFDELDLLTLPHNLLRKLRGSSISMVFQEPMSSLNPIFTIGYQIAEQIIAHKQVTKKEAWIQTIEIFKEVGITNPTQRAIEFPHQLNGGLRQRVMIAMSLIMRPKLLIADEPTTALDVTNQAQILDLIRKLQQKNETTILLITHNLAAVAKAANHVAVMYTGRIIELTLTKDLFTNPLHPYTQGLLACSPAYTTKTKIHLYSIPGIIPTLDNLPNGCTFSNRCSKRLTICQKVEPALVNVNSKHKVRCFLHHKHPRQ